MSITKDTISRLYKEYKGSYLNELYDTPLEFKKESNTKYFVYKESGEELAYFLFSFMYNIDDSPINYKKYKLNKYWDISWYWINGLSKEDKTVKNFLKITSTAFKIVDDFIRQNNHPALLGFSGLSQSHENLYSNKLFIDRWQILFGERYYVEWKNDKMWIINKNFYRIDENRLVRHSEFQQKSLSEIYKQLKFPNKKDLSGISKFNLVKEQIKRVILKQIYIKP